MAIKRNIENEEVAEITEVSKLVVFTKEQIVSAKKYIHKRDVVNVVLKDGQSYSLDEVDDLIEKFMKEVKVICH